MKRLRWSREVWLLIALLSAVAAFTAFVGVRQREIEAQEEISTTYSSHATDADGTRALYEWLARLGYRVERLEYRAFEIAPATRALFVIGPLDDIARNEAEYILAWVARGNTLIMADKRAFINNAVYSKLQIELETLERRATSAALTQPFMDAESDTLHVSTFNGLDISRGDFVAYASANEMPLIARLQYERGVVWLLTTPELFTNESLRDANNAKFTAALISTLPREGVIAFDEYHHGLTPEEADGLIPLLYDTPWGWGILFTIVVCFAYLAINGQRLGRVLPVPKTLARRSPSEYVTSMANLFRRANKRGMVLQHYRHSLKRRLGRPYHLNPELADERYVELLTRLRPELDHNELVRILNSLRRLDTTEADLVKTIEHAVTFGGRAGRTQ